MIPACSPTMAVCGAAVKSLKSRTVPNASDNGAVRRADSVPAARPPTRRTSLTRTYAGRSGSRRQSRCCPRAVNRLVATSVAVQAEAIRQLAEFVRRSARMAAAAPANGSRVSARGCRPRLSAPMTDVVMPDECQSMPMTEPSA